MKFCLLLIAAALLAFCIPASAVDLDAVMERLERLEADNKRMATENVLLKQRLNKIEGLKQSNENLAKEPHKRLATNDLSGRAYERDKIVKSDFTEVADSWSGTYGGLNVGYGWGASNQVNTETSTLKDQLYFVPKWEVHPGQGVSVPNPPVGTAALSTSGASSLSQRGILGGIQAGYNKLIQQKIIAGVETDIQGTSIQANGSHYGVAPQAFNAKVSDLSGAYDYISVLNYTGINNINASVDWLGTLRGRLGWLATNKFLIYSTAGAAYGNVSATSDVSASATGTYYVPTTYPSYGALAVNSTTGNGQYSALRFGWTAGAGVEWMFMPKWSVKAEGLYYDLGSVSMRSSPFGVVGSNLNQAITTIHYDGVLARAGINYHFNSWPNL